MSLTKVTYSMIEGAFTNVLDFGASSSASAAANLAAFNLAIASTPVGGTLFVPAGAATYLIDTSGGLSSAIEIDKRMTIYLEGTLQPSFQAIQANPPTIFYITADYVTLTGTGVLKGDGTTNSVNTGSDATLPSLVRVTGDYFTMTGLTVDTPFKVGIHLVGANSAKITENNFTGGPTVYTDTAYFGVRISNGDRHIVSNNQFFPSGTGGMYVQCIFSSNGNECVYESNVAHKPYEKLVYLNGNYNIVNGNTVIGNTSTIPGTNQTGTVGVVYRCDGAYNKITNNFSNYGGGAAVRFGGGNDISNNTFLNCGQSAIAVFNGTSAFDYTSICDNICVCGNLAGIYVTDGIYISADVGSSKQLMISGNIVKGFAPTNPIANVPVWQATTTYGIATVKPTTPNGFYYITNGGVSAGTEPTWPTSTGATVTDGTVTWTAAQVSTGTASIRIIAPNGSVGQINEQVIISNNTVRDTRVGIVTDYMENSMVSNNELYVTTQGIVEFNANYNKYRYNRVEGSVTVGIGSISATTKGEGNTYNGTDIVVDSQMGAGTAAYTVPNAEINVASNAYVVVTAANQTAATFMATHGIYATLSVPNVIVRSGSGTNFAGTEIFRIHAIQ
jgi:hypothetical protein